jgi:hypothetical protein
MAVGGAIAESKQRSGAAASEAPDLPRVTWYKHKGLIKLYLVRFLLLRRLMYSSFWLSSPRRPRLDMMDP